jgi:hypothetical protein
MSNPLLNRLIALATFRTQTARTISSSQPRPAAVVDAVDTVIGDVKVPGGWLLSDAKKLQNKVVLIAGTGRLDGFAGQLAVEAAHYGAKVVVGESSETGRGEVVGAIKANGGCVLSPSSDLDVCITDSSSSAELLPASPVTSPTGDISRHSLYALFTLAVPFCPV